LPLLEIIGLTKSFGGVKALQNVSISVERGDVLGLIGPNGAGKTTLFDIVTGLQKPSSGKVLFEGKNILGLRPHEICRIGIARTYQSVRPFLNHTVRENILVGVLYGADSSRPLDRDKRIEEILMLLGLKDRQYQLAKNLPIEQRKMVEVGRALGANPKLLLLDEPMAGLNASEMHEFVSLIKTLKEKGVTVVIVEHVMKAISSACSRVIVLHLGQLIASGSPEEVLSDKRVVDVYLGESYSRSRG
jgi:branched-chain amino acid transport system ATP-binding protein